MTSEGLPAAVQRALAHGAYLLGQSKEVKLEVLSTLGTQRQGEGAGISFGDQFRVVEQTVRNFARGVVRVFEFVESLGPVSNEASRWADWAAISAASKRSRVLRFQLERSFAAGGGTELRSDHKWRFPGSVSWSVSSYEGGEATHSVVDFARAEHSGSRYYNWNYAASATQSSAELDATWLLQAITTPFAIDRSSDRCRTPRRNTQVECALAFAVRLSEFAATIRQAVMASEDYQEDYFDGEVFIPSTPLFLRRDDDPRADIDFFDGDRVDTEHARSLQENLQLIDRRHLERTPKLAGAAVTDWLGSPVVSRLLYLTQHLQALCASLRATTRALEESLLLDIQGRLGVSHLRSAAFHDYLRYHCCRRLSAAVAARPFALPVRSGSQHCPEGTVSLQDGAGEPLPTFVQDYGRHKVQFRLDAATLVSVDAACSLHGFVSASFAGALSFGGLSLSLRARQFSCYLVLLGRLQGPSLFDPQYAVLVQNKDLLDVPLDVFLVPSAQEFADAIASMSPQQQAFAKAYRDMQLASTHFAILVVPVRPLLERLLGLPPDSLDKDIALTQDLVRLFAELQIPADLLSCQPHKANAVAPLDQVRTNVARLLDSIGNIGPSRDRANLFTVEDALRQLDIERYHLSLPGVAELLEQQPGNFDSDGLFTAVLDIGTHKTLAGFGGESWLSETKTVVGRPRHMGVMVGMGQKDSYTGAECDSAPPSIEKPPGADDDAGGASSTSESDDSSCTTTATSTASSVELRDFTQVPGILDARFQALGGAGAVRPLILTPARQWYRQVRTSLLDEVGTPTSLNEREQLAEKKLAFDLLDCLSRSAGLVLQAGELHVIVGAAHCFDQSLMSLLVEDNINPISVLERSIHTVEQTIHDH